MVIKPATHTCTYTTHIHMHVHVHSRWTHLVFHNMHSTAQGEIPKGTHLHDIVHTCICTSCLCCCSLLMVSSAAVSSASFLISCCCDSAISVTRSSISCTRFCVKYMIIMGKRYQQFVVLYMYVRFILSPSPGS